MDRKFRSVAAWSSLVLALFLTLATRVASQQPESEEPTLTQEVVQQRIQLITDDPQRDPDAKNEVLEVYRRALQDLSDHAARETLLNEWRRQEENAKPELERAKQQRGETPDSAPVVAAPSDSTLQALEQELGRKEQILRDLTAALTQLDAEPKRRAARLEEISPAIATARRNIEQTQADYQVLQQDQTPLGEAKRASAIARRMLLNRQIEMLEAERRAYEATTELVQVRRDIAAAAVLHSTEEVKNWRQLINNRRRQEAERQASEARSAVIQASPELRELAQHVQSLAEERTELAHKIENTSRRLEQSRQLRNELATNYERAKERVQASGLSQASGEILRRQRASLPDRRQYRRDIGQRRSELGEMRFKAYERQDERLALASLEQRVQDYLTVLPRNAPAETANDVRELLESKRDSLDFLINDYNTYQNSQLELSDVERELIETAEQYSAFIDERVLWIRSTYPWSPMDLKPAADAAAWLSDVGNWRNLGIELWNDARNNLWLYIPLGLFFIVLLYASRPIKAAIQHRGAAVTPRGYYRFGPTLQTFGLTVLLSAIWPGVVGFLAWRGASVYSASPFVLAFSLAMQETARNAFALEFLRQVCRGKGLAECHYQWPLGMISTTRNAVRAAAFIGLPLLLVVLTLQYQTLKPLWSASLGRMVFVVLMIVSAVILDRLVRRKSGLLHHVLLYSSTLAHRLRHLWAPIIILAPLALAIMALLGYYHTAVVLGQRFFATGSMLFGLRIINDLLKRGVLMRRRRLTITQIRERRRLAELAAASDGDSSRTDRGPTMQETYDEVDLGTVSQQSVKLLQVVAVFVGFTGAWVIWDDVVPALSMLNNYPVWPGAALTFAELLLALVIAIVAWAAASNLPGVLELMLLHYLPVDAGARYATTSILRYVIAMVGIAAVSRTLGFTMERAQWFIATMGIGLGFGLQEIFANFISGIILLFERPIRVGDIVTLDNTTGLVTRIRMRATTITDWDNKEYVVPNKDLVTGRLLNWTLSDMTNRVVIPIGLAHGSDTDKACSILLEVARNQPLLMKEPAPVAAFESFGENSLNVSLRCYLPSIENRLKTIHELHTAIAKAFRAAHIEIAFPRRDINIRSIDQPLRTVQEHEHQTMS